MDQWHQPRDRRPVLVHLAKTKFLPNGSYCNVKFSKDPCLIQQLWVNAHSGYRAWAVDE